MFRLQLRKPALWSAAAAAACSLLVVAGFAVGHPRAPRGDWPLSSLVTAWSGWDGEWYQHIATQGYFYSGPNAQSPVAFFPAYPMAIRALGAVGLNPWVAGALLSLTAGLLALALYFRWAKRLAPDEDSARWATALMTVYPFAFYLYGALYSDSLFLALAIAAFLSLEDGKVWRAAALGALATAARPLAPALVIGLLVRGLELRRRRGERPRLVDAVPLLAATGMIAYAAYLGYAFGDPIAFAHVQAAPGWDQPAGWHTALKISWWNVISDTISRAVAVRFIGHAYVAVFGLLLVIPTRRLLGWGYAVYVLAAIGMPTVSSKDFMGLGRYALAAFPMFLTLALLLKERPRLRAPWVATSAAILFALAYAYGTGAYVS